VPLWIVHPDLVFAGAVPRISARLPSVSRASALKNRFRPERAGRESSSSWTGHHSSPVMRVGGPPWRGAVRSGGCWSLHRRSSPSVQRPMRVSWRGPVGSCFLSVKVWRA